MSEENSCIHYVKNVIAENTNYYEWKDCFVIILHVGVTNLMDNMYFRLRLLRTHYLSKLQFGYIHTFQRRPAFRLKLSV